MTIFDFIKNLTVNKTRWDNYSEAEKKEFNVYMLNRWLSMEPNITETVNSLQHLTIGLLEPKDTYNLYYHLLPQKALWLKYTTSKKESKYNTELIDYMCKYFELGEDDIYDHLDILYQDLDLQEVKTILSKYGLTEKEIRKIIALKKIK